VVKPDIAIRIIEFRAKHPNNRTGAHRKADNEDEQRKYGEIAQLGMLSIPMLKTVPTAIMAAPMVTKPAYMIGLRPSLSTNAMADVNKSCTMNCGRVFRTSQFYCKAL
jgi:hypothetical protein